MATLDMAGIITRICTKLKDKFAPIGSRHIWYGTCSTPASTAAKVVTVSDSNFALEDGNTIIVDCKTASINSGSNTYTLNVNGTGAKQVALGGSSSDLLNPLTWEAHDVITFVYDSSMDRYVLASRYKSVEVVQNLQEGVPIGTVNGVTLYAPQGGGGGGGGSTLTLYSDFDRNGRMGAVYMDSAKTTLLVAYYDYDYASIWGALNNADAVVVKSTDGKKKATIIAFSYDTADDDIDVKYCSTESATIYTDSW